MMTQARKPDPHSPAELLDFWFGAPGSPERGRDRAMWWEADPGFDAELRRRFLALHEAAAAGALDAWRATPEGALALTVALDQLPRNMFRGTPRAYGTDAQAREVAKAALARGDDRGLPFEMAKFFYMPLMHSEKLEDQRRCLALCKARPEGAGAADFARGHLEIVERFGRFPHRNAILGRPSTEEELEFLKQPGSSY
jgi:uncharacterized protein (DUF924 family)